MARIILPKWALEPTVPDRAAMDSILTAYNSHPNKPGADPVLARGAANPLWPFIQSMVVFGFNFNPPRGRGPESLCVMDNVPFDILDEIVPSLAELARTFQRTLAAGGDIENFPVFFQFPAAGLTTDAPANWPSRSFIETDDSDPPVETEVVRTVQEYFGASANFSEYPKTFDGGTTYVAPAQDPWNGGAHFPASVFMNQSGAVTLRTVDWYLSQQPAE